MEYTKRFFILLAFVLCLPAAVHAAPLKQSLEVSGWIPYWRAATGTAEVTPHLKELTEVNPFGYIVQQDGTLLDAMKVADEPWRSFIKQAKANKVRVIPTVMWCDADSMHRILGNQASRVKLEDDIAALAVRENFDGIDIDFECKHAQDKDNFSTFLRGLYARMGTKWVMCSIESRTPLESRYDGVTPPADATMYANDFVQINKYCDRVKLMTYDQQTVDMKLGNAANKAGVLYAPLSDPAWIKKVIALVSEEVSKKKLVLGIPTYGYEWAVTAYADGYTYDLLWSFNPKYAIDLAKALKVTPTRTTTGEIGFSYVPTTTKATFDTGTNAAASALTAAKANNSNHTFRFMTWEDGVAIAQKAALAKELGLRGVAFFKFDGGADPQMWNTISGI